MRAESNFRFRCYRTPQLAALCNEYPGFHAFAVLMEEAAEAERRKLARPYDDLPELPDAVKARLASLLGTAAQLQRDYQSVRDAGSTSAPVRPPPLLSRRHAQWDADRTDLVATLQAAGVPRKAQDIILPALTRIAQQIDQLKAGPQAT